jgi:hypothetical protein
MRRIIASVLVLSSLTWASFASAQEPSPSVAPTAPGAAVTSTTTSTPDSTSSTTTATTTPAVAPEGASTTTTTQAGIDVTPTPARVSSSEYGGETTTTWVNRPLLGTGVVLLGGTYAASAIVAAESSRPQDRPNLYYPVAGPWMDLGQRGAGNAGQKALLVLDGVGQGLGALAIVSSLFIPEKKERHWFFVGTEKLQVAPTTVGYGGYGMGAAGHF